jgi:GT2 family glycosyltransferase
MVIAGEPPPETVQTLHALQQQTTPHWTLTVVASAAWQTSFTALVAVSGLQRTSQRVRVVYVTDLHPAEMLRHGLRGAGASDVALLFPGDVWAPDAVAQLANAVSPRVVAYADEDCRDAGGDHTAPRLKPDYSPDFLLTSGYTGRPLALGADIAQLLAASLGTPDLLEHDVALRGCAAAERVVHIPEVLCHRLIAPLGPHGADTGQVIAALARRNEAADVAAGETPGTCRVRRSVPVGTTASIIIPFRDEPKFLRACIASIDTTAAGIHPELILIDNGSVQPETATLVERLAQRDDTTVLADARPFNWAELNNVAARDASGDVLVFLNNDIEAVQHGWLDRLVAQAMRADVGAVGARLLYPDGRLQHCGVVIGLGGAAGHVLIRLDQHQPGYLNMAVCTRECAAVTGACLATRRDVFESLSGFDVTLGIDLNDIDYCLRGQRRGLRVIYEREAELVHHESPSRGTAGDVKDIVRFIDRWKDSIVARDPYLNPNLTRVDSSCALRGPEEEEWWRQWHASLSPQ